MAAEEGTTGSNPAAQKSQGPEQSAVNQLDGLLIEVVAQFGRRIVDRPDRLRAALADTLGADAGHARERLEGVVTASASGVASQIRDTDPNVAATPDQIRQWFDELMHAGLSLRDAALATHSWASAFNASATAQMTSEVSDELLAQSEEREQTVPEPTAHEPEPERESSLVQETEFGPDEAVSQTIGVDHTIAAEVARPREAVTAEQLAAFPPPSGRPTRLRTQRNSQPSTTASTAVSTPDAPRGAWLEKWWLAVAAGGTAVLALAIGAPMAMAARPAELPPVGSIGEPGPILFTEGELALLIPHEKELRILAPQAKEVVVPQRFADGAEVPADQSISPKECESLAWFGVPTSGGASPTFGSYAWNIEAGSALAFARTYATPDAAIAALDTLTDVSCTSMQATIAGTTYPVTVEAKPSRAVTDEYRIDEVTQRFESGVVKQRLCGAVLNAVVCYYSQLVNVDSLGTADSPQDLFDALSKRLAEAEPLTGKEQ